MGRKKILDLSAYKFTFNIEGDVKESLDDLTDQYHTKYGPMINIIIKALCIMPDKMKKAFISFCKAQIRDLNKQIATAGGYEKQQLESEKKQYLEFARLINQGYEITVSEEDNGMTEIEIQDGVLIIPKDWIIVNPEDAKNHRYAAVLECRNSSKYGIPHFVMFCDDKYANEYSNEFENEFKRLCRKAWSAFEEEVEKKQLKLVQNEDGSYINGDKYLAAPTIGIFNIWESDDEHLAAMDNEPPYGSMIVRTNVEEK